MQLNVTDQRYVVIPVYGPDGEDLTQFTPVKAAIIPEADGEPTSGQYVTASWVQGSADVEKGTALLQTLVTANSLTNGVSYMAWVTFTAGQEIPVIKSGRILVGAGA